MSRNYSASEIFELCRQHWPETHTAAHQVALLLHRLAETDMSQVREITQRHGLSPAEFDILATLRRTPRPNVLSPTELQRSTLLSSGGQTKLLYQLEDKGLVDRSVDAQDKRSKRVHLTAKGRRVVEKAMGEILAEKEAWLKAAGLSPKEVAQLAKLAEKLLSQPPGP